MRPRLLPCLAVLMVPGAARPSLAQSSAATLERVVARLEASQLERSPLLRVQRGLPIERLPDLSLAAAQEEGREAESLLRELKAVRPADLSGEALLTLEVLRWQLALDAEQPRFHWLDFSAVTPYATVLQAVSRIFASRPLSTAADVDAYLRLLQQLPPLIDSIGAGLAERARRGIRLSQQELPLVLGVLRSWRQRPDSSAWLPGPDRLTRLEAATGTRLREDATRRITSEVNPAFDRVLALLEAPAYRDAAPRGVGLWQYPGGREYYRHLVRRHTTIDITPRQVHDVGLRDVARIEREMAAIRTELGFAGTHVEFLAALRNDPRFYATTPDEVGAKLTDYQHRIEPAIPRYFSTTPRARGDARRLDPRLEPAMTFGYYQEPTTADSMGHYFYNGSRLGERSTITAAPLIYHELIPGHHYQFARQLENRTLPGFRRAYAVSAFTEGWGEYASQLAGEMGMYTDPYDRYGRLLMEMFLACRLVVDTGMNEFGWSRDSAKAYMGMRVIESPVQLETETLRYSSDLPGQALAYKMGSLELLRLRERAHSALGGGFDIRAFHEVVLSSGSLPLSVLAGKVERWLAHETRAAR